MLDMVNIRKKKRKKRKKENLQHYSVFDIMHGSLASQYDPTGHGSEQLIRS